MGEGEFDGYLKDAVNKLRPKLPLPLPEYSDLFQEVRIWGIEACEKYQEGRGAVFTTFLYGHLRLRSMQWFNYCWMPCNQPKAKWVFSFSVLRDEEGNDPQIEQKEPALLDAEIKSRLSERNQQLFDYFVEYIDWEVKHGGTTLLKAFSSIHNVAKVSKLTSLPKYEVDDFVSDLKKAREEVVSSKVSR